LSAQNSELISTYWKEFASYSSYKVLINEEFTPCLVTKNGDKTVGAILHSKNSTGVLVFLPDIDFYQDKFLNEDSEWTKEAIQFSARFIKSIVSLDKTLRNSSELTPEPEWAKEEIYVTIQHPIENWQFSFKFDSKCTKIEKNWRKINKKDLKRIIFQGVLNGYKFIN